MKNKYLAKAKRQNNGCLTKIFKIMKISALLLFFGILQVFAYESYAQSTKLTLSLTDVTIGQVLEEIEAQSEFYILYNHQLVDVSRKVNIDVSDKNIDGILLALFEDTDVESYVLGRQIILSPRDVLIESLDRLKRTQEGIEIKGTIVDGNGNSLPGVNVIVKGTTIGAISDANGNYTIIVEDPNATLVFSFIGFTSQEIPVDGKLQINVELLEESIGLEEVVAIGYGTQRKATLTGATSIVKGESLDASMSAGLGGKLQGELSGVSITNDNQPGGESNINIRGISTINNNNPLYIIDGVPSSDGLVQINSYDIESISVLKDASSSAIYGVRAANGVIIITTKRGRNNQAPQLKLSARLGIQNAKINKINERMCTPQEYADMLWLEFENEGYSQGDPGWYHPQFGDGLTPVLPDYIFPGGVMEGDPLADESLYSYPDPYYGITRANKEGTDWYNEIFDRAIIQEYNLSVSGGSEKSTYAFSAGYLNQEGVVTYTGFNRLSARLNSDTKIKKWLEFGENLSVSFSDQLSFIPNAERNAVSVARDFQTIIPVYDIMGNFAGTKSPGMGGAENPVAFNYRNKDNHVKQTRLLGNIYGQINFLNDFHFKSFLGIDYRSGHGINRTLKNPESSQVRVYDLLSENYNGGNQWNWTNTLNYTRSFDNHNLNVLVGGETVKYYMANLTAARDIYFAQTVDYMIIDAGEGNQTNSGNFDEWATLSYFARVNYNYQGKYLAEVVVRRDASSRFSEANRWGTFPAFSLGWRISDEAFMNSINWLDNLKLRFGWGTNGNDQIGNYNAYSTFGPDIASTYYPIDGSASTAVAGFKQLTLGDMNAKWETTITTNGGIDATFFNRKLSLSLDIYEKLTTDMLYQKQMPSVFGNIILPSINIGEMKNTGFDSQLTFRTQIGNDLNITIGANLSAYRNEVLKLNDREDEIIYLSGAREGAGAIITAGQPMGVFYGLEVEGIFNTQEEVENHVPYNADNFGDDTYSRPGVFKYKDVNGDGRINSDDRKVIGNPHPDFTYGFNIGADYKGFDIQMSFFGSYGNDIIDYSDVTGQFNVLIGRNKFKSRLYESWTNERYLNAEEISQPIALISDAVMVQSSSHFVQNGSYLRLKYLQVGYTLPSRIASKADIDNVRIYLQGTNILTLTKYTGLDPEVISSMVSGYTMIGIDNGVYPISQTFSLGVNINF